VSGCGVGDYSSAVMRLMVVVVVCVLCSLIVLLNRSSSVASQLNINCRQVWWAVSVASCHGVDALSVGHLGDCDRASAGGVHQMTTTVAQNTGCHEIPHRAHRVHRAEIHAWVLTE